MMPHDEPASGQHRHRVLLVEDHADFRRAAAELLRLEGYETDEAPAGLEALHALRTGPPPCVVLLDLHLPDISGRDFRAAQLRDCELAGIPVVAVSGWGGVAQAARAMRMDAYLEKPLDLDKLLVVLRRVCRRAA